MRWTVAAIEYAPDFSHTPFMSLRSFEASRRAFESSGPLIYEQHSSIIWTSYIIYEHHTNITLTRAQYLNIQTVFADSHPIHQMIFKEIWERISIKSVWRAVSNKHCSPYTNIYRSISSDYLHRFVSLTDCKLQSSAKNDLRASSK